VQYWIDQQAVARGGQPWFYYLLLLLLYEFLVTGISVVGIPYWLRRRTTFTNFLLYWSLGSLLLWGWASEKMPWMVIEMALPLCLLAAATLGRFIEAMVTIRHVNPLSVRHGLTILALVLLALLAPFSAYTAVRASFANGDVPVELLVYTQTTPDVLLVMRMLDKLARQSGAGVGGLTVAYDAGLSTPFEWYLRDDASRTTFDRGNPSLDAAVVLAGGTGSGLASLRLGPGYESHEYRLLWWFPEDETYKTWTPSSVVEGLLDPSQWLTLWRYVVYREPPVPLGGNTFDVFVRRDLAAEFWSEP
jgi:predicted membrane-bound mannosyltransferase